MEVEGVWEELLNVLHAKARKSVDREESPSLGIVDSRSVKTSHQGDLDAWVKDKFGWELSYKSHLIDF